MLTIKLVIYNQLYSRSPLYINPALKQFSFHYCYTVPHHTLQLLNTAVLSAYLTSISTITMTHYNQNPYLSSQYILPQITNAYISVFFP